MVVGNPMGDKNTARLGTLGITAQPYEPFGCVIPGHDHQATVSPGGRYKCADQRGTHALASILGKIRYGRDRHIGRYEEARWGELMDHLAGLVVPAHVPIDIPDAPPEAAALAPALLRLVGLRTKWALSHPFTFSRGWQPEDGPLEPGFGSAYSGLSPDAIRRGLRCLEKDLEWIERVGQGRPIQWRLRGVA